MRSTIALVVAAALSSAAIAQVGTDPAENKIPINQSQATATPPSDAPPTTDDAAPADRADAPANTSDQPPDVTPPPGDPASASGPPPKR